MKLEQSFTVDAPVEQVWSALIDVERIAPCLPGAEITGVDASGAYQGDFSVKLGPTTAAYRGTLRMEAVDEAARTVTMSAKGTDKRGQGGASATIVSTMREEGGATHVDVLTDFHITGRLARFGRSGMIEDVSRRLMRDFAGCLQATLVADGGAVSSPSAPGPASGSAPGPASASASGEPDPADAAVASAGAAAVEAASAGAAPPGAADLASGPAAPAPAPGGPPPLVGRPVERATPPAPAEPAAEAPRTGWLSDWPDGGEETPSSAEPPAADSSSTPVAEPAASEPPVPSPGPAGAAEPDGPAPGAAGAAEPLGRAPGAGVGDSSSVPAVEPGTSAPERSAGAVPEPPAPPPQPAAPAPATEPPARAPAPPAPPPQPASPQGEAAAAAVEAEAPPVRTESIPPPGWSEPAPTPSAKPKRGGPGIGERIKRLLGRKKNT